MAKGSNTTRSSGANTRSMSVNKQPSKITPLQINSVKYDNRLGRVDYNDVNASKSLSKQVRQTARDTIVAMFERYNIPSLKGVNFVLRTRDASEYAHYNPKENTITFASTKRNIANGINGNAVHEMTHAMLGGDFSRTPKDLWKTIRDDYENAKSNISDRGYWRTSAEEYAAETMRKVLTGEKYNSFEEHTFRAIETHFRKK